MLEKMGIDDGQNWCVDYYIQCVGVDQMIYLWFGDVQILGYIGYQFYDGEFVGIDGEVV